MTSTRRIVTPDLTEYIQGRKNDIKSEINCIAIGTVQSFDSNDQTVNVQINYVRVLTGGTATDAPNNDDTTRKLVPYPILVKCPLMMLSGGQAVITFPVAQGDSCIILFNDRDMDTWWNSGIVGNPPNSARLHDLSDGIVIVGIRNLTNAIQGYFNGFKIGYGNASITIDPSGNIIITGTTVSINPCVKIYAA